MNTLRAGVLVLCIVIIMGFVAVSYTTAATKVLPPVQKKIISPTPTVKSITLTSSSKLVTPKPTPKKTVTPKPTPKKTVTPIPTPKKIVTPVPTPKKTVTIPAVKKTPATESKMITGLQNTILTSQISVNSYLQQVTQRDQAIMQEMLKILNQRMQQSNQQSVNTGLSNLLFSMKNINTLPKPCYKCSIDVNKGVGQLLTGSASVMPGRGYNFSGIGGIGGIGSGLLMFSPAPTGGTKAGDKVKSTGGGGGFVGP